jgi:hypothetical protein
MQIAVLLVGVLFMPAAPSVDQAQYFYDELGRLVGVVEKRGHSRLQDNHYWRSPLNMAKR